MLAESVAYAHFLVPHGFEMLDQVILRSFDPSASHDEVAAIEVTNAQVGNRRYAPFVVSKPAVEPLTLLACRPRM